MPLKITFAKYRRDFIAAAVLALVYFAVGKLGLAHPMSRQSLTPIWPPSGVAIAALLLLGYRVWPGILVGALAIELTTSCTIGTALGVAVGNVFESLAGAWLANRFAGGRHFYERPWDVLKFALLVGMVAPLLSPPLGVRVLSPNRFILWPAIEPDRLIWWLSDLVSIVVVTPLLLVWAAKSPIRWGRWRALEFLLLLLLLLLTAVAVFGRQPEWARGYLFPYLCLPFLSWAAFRFGERETVTANFVLGLVVMWSAVQGFGLFHNVAYNVAYNLPHNAGVNVGEQADEDDTQNKDKDLLVYQAFVATSSVMVLALAAVVGQQRRAGGALRRAHDELELRVQQRTVALQREAAERHRKENELHRLNRTLKALSHASQALIRASGERVYLQDICKIIAEHCGHQMVWVGLAEQDKDKTVRPVAWAGFEEGYLETLHITWADTDRGRGPTGTAIRTRQVCICRDVRTDPSFNPWRGEAMRRGYASSISLPLLAEGKAFGVLAIYSREEDPFGEDEVRLLTELADDLAYGITNLRLRAAHAVAEQTLKESQTRLRQLAENIREVFWLGSPDWKEIFYINPAYEEIWGRSCQSLYESPESWLEAVLPEDRHLVVEGLETGVSGALPLVFPPYRIARPDGTVRWIQARAWPIRDDQGCVYRIAGIAENITERKRSEEDREQLMRLLGSEKARWQATVDNMPEPVLLCDATGQATYMNAAYCRLLGRDIKPGTEMQGDAVEYQLYRTDGTLFDSRDLPLQRAALSGETVRDVELTQLGSDGSEHVFLWNAAPLRDPAGRVTGAVALGRDITEQRRAERALRTINQELEQRVAVRTASLEATISDLEDFSHSITHDLRAPLRAMSMFGELLQQECRECGRPAAQDHVERIITASRRMDHLIRDVLQYSRLARSELTLTAVNVASLLRGIVGSYPALQSSHADIEIEEPMPMVLGNEAALTQCFSNLLDNAVKFVAPGTRPHVRICAETTGTVARIIFADNGVGIPEEAQERIFKLFQRLDKRHEGTGVGLTVVRKAMEKLGGRVGCESEPGQGARFWLELSVANP